MPSPGQSSQISNSSIRTTGTCHKHSQLSLLCILFFHHLSIIRERDIRIRHSPLFHIANLSSSQSIIVQHIIHITRLLRRHKATRVHIRRAAYQILTYIHMYKCREVQSTVALGRSAKSFYCLNPLSLSEMPRLIPAGLRLCPLCRCSSQSALLLPCGLSANYNTSPAPGICRYIALFGKDVATSSPVVPSLLTSCLPEQLPPSPLATLFRVPQL